MTIIIQRRKSGIKVGGCGGLIMGGFDTLEKLDEPPKQRWEEYLLNEHGHGYFMVTKCSGNKTIKILFKGQIGIR